MSATNYARNRTTRVIVFLYEGELPESHHLGPEWAWHEPPEPHPRARFALLIGESMKGYEERIKREQS